MKALGSGGSGGAIELRQVTKRYNREAVVDCVSTSIAPGEFFSLLGPSGSGKTTTLMMVAGFAEVDGGQILVDGTDIAHTPPQRRGFGMVFQNYAIFPHLSVADNVAFPLRARRLPAEQIGARVRAALELVRLERYADRYSRELSGGQQQRVAIARAIVFQPSIVLMDEPLGALDKNLRFQMQVEIKEIQRRLGMTVIYVTHDQEEAMNMSDRIAIMNNGRIEQIGRPAEIYENPASTFIARFLGEANLIPGTVESVDAAGAVLRTARGVALRARAEAGIRVGAAAHLFVRPERIEIAPLAADSGSAHNGGRSVVSDLSRRNAITGADANAASGRLAQTSFLGNILRHAVEIEPGVEVTVDVQNSRADLFRSVDQAAALSWRVADSVILQR
jgi:putative spermidine/putrescine transport system ATP-binding protein